MRVMSEPLRSATDLAFCSNTYEARDLYREIYEEEQYSIDWDNLPSSPVILDIGAHIGMFASWVLRNRPSATLLCVEAAPETADVLRANFAGRSNVEIVQTFAGSDRRPVSFSFFPNCTFLSGRDVSPESVKNRVEKSVSDWSWRHGKAASAASRAAETLGENRSVVRQVQMATTPTVELLQRCGPAVDVVKIDVEGGELAVLRGIPPGWWANIRRVVVESALEPFEREAIVQHLHSVGFRNRFQDGRMMFSSAAESA